MLLLEKQTGNKHNITDIPNTEDDTGIRQYFADGLVCENNSLIINPKKTLCGLKVSSHTD